MKLDLRVVYGRVVHSESQSYTSGIDGTIWTDVIRSIHVRFDSRDGEGIYNVNAAFPARSGDRVGVIYGRTSAFRIGKEKCLGLINGSTGSWWVFERRWVIPLAIPLLLICFFLVLKAAKVMPLWTAGKYVDFVLAVLPSPLGRSGLGSIDGLIWLMVVVSFYPVYKLSVWRQIKEFARATLRA